MFIHLEIVCFMVHQVGYDIEYAYPLYTFVEDQIMSHTMYA